MCKCVCLRVRACVCVCACVFVCVPCFCVEVYSAISVLAINLSRKRELVALLVLWLSVFCVLLYFFQDRLNTWKIQLGSRGAELIKPTSCKVKEVFRSCFYLNNTLNVALNLEDN